MGPIATVTEKLNITETCRELSMLWWTERKDRKFLNEALDEEHYILGPGLTPYSRDRVFRGEPDPVSCVILRDEEEDRIRMEDAMYHPFCGSQSCIDSDGHYIPREVVDRHGRSPRRWERADVYQDSSGDDLW